MAIGDNVKAIRKEKKLTQTELANTMGISRSYLGDIENNRKNPSSKTLEMLAEKLEVSMLYLLEGKKTMHDLLNNSITKDLAEGVLESFEKDDVFKTQIINFSINENNGENPTFNGELLLNNVTTELNGYYFMQINSLFSNLNPALFIHFNTDTTNGIFDYLLKKIALEILKKIDYKQDEQDTIPIIFVRPEKDGHRAIKIEHINM